jgi:hypothetical protein
VCIYNALSKLYINYKIWVLVSHLDGQVGKLQEPSSTTKHVYSRKSKSLCYKRQIFCLCVCVWIILSLYTFFLSWVLLGGTHHFFIWIWVFNSPWFEFDCFHSIFWSLSFSNSKFKYFHLSFCYWRPLTFFLQFASRMSFGNIFYNWIR